MNSKIKNVIDTNEANIVILELHNNKKIKRIIKRSVNDDSKYFKFDKQEYFLNELFTKGICFIN